MNPLHAQLQHLNDAANAAIGAGDLAAARASITAMLALTPQDTRIVCWLANLEFQCHRLDQAQAWLDRVAQLQPPPEVQERARMLQGVLYGARHQYDEAIATLQGMQGPQVAALLGRCYSALHEFPAALAMFERCPADPAIAAGHARALLATGQYERGEAMLLRLAGAEGDERHWSTLWLGLSLMDRECWGQVTATMVPLAEDPETTLPALAVLAEMALRHGDLELCERLLPPNARSNWAHAWVVQSVCAMRKLQHSHGIAPFARRVHPYPDSPLGMTCSSLRYYGRFAHQLGDYLFLRSMADQYGVTLETPDWVGHYIFELDDPLPSGPRTPVRRRFDWIARQAGASGVQALLGRDFFSPGFDDPLPSAFVGRAREVLRIRPEWETLLAPAMACLHARGRTVVALHLRLTDRASDGVELGWYLEWLRALWPQLDQPVLYLASDDIDAVAPHFRDFNLVCLNDLPFDGPGVQWLADFHILSQADIVAISVGDFALMASMLNSRARLVMRPLPDGSGLGEYRF